MAEAKGDDGAEKSMSLDEFKQEMFRSLRDTGTVEMIRAQLRRKFIEKLQQHGMKDHYASRDVGVGGAADDHTGGGINAYAGEDEGSENNRNNSNNIVDAKKRMVTQWSGDEKLVNGLLFDYFDKKALEHSAAVFVPEIGGAKSYVAADTILQLRRVETAYLFECENAKHEPKRSLEERMFQYQSECDALAEKRLQEELERFKTMELALMRVEERKKYEKEADKLRSSLLQEHRQKSERLQEKERDLELAFVAKRTELETSLFETRQSLFQEMEKLRVKEAQLQVKVETDFRNFAAEIKRLQLWEETMRTQEKNLERLVAQAIHEKEHELQLERSKLTHLLKVKEEELLEREGVLNCEKEGIKAEKLKHKALQDDLVRMEEALSSMEQSWKDAFKTVAKLEEEKKRMQDDMDVKENDAKREKGTLQSLSASNARLTAEKELLQSEIERYKAVLSEQEIIIKQLTFELKDSQQQLLAIKMDEANALVSERKRFMKALDDDREQFQWKENELLAKLRDFQSRLAESEAAVEKFHSQYEDEKLHVESLRQEVTNLNALLSQAQATINAKHGMVSSATSHRASRGGGSSEMGIASGDFGSSDRMLIMRMMEMMSRSFQSGNQFPHMGVQQQPGNTDPSVVPVNYHQPVHSSSCDVSQPHPSPPPAALPSEQTNADHEDARKLKEEQQRIERELLEQREYERKKAERMAQEEREIAERRRLFDEELARQRQVRLEEDDRLETERRRKLAEEEEKMQQELDKQRKALQDPAELQQRLAEERSTADKQRLQDEQARQERMHAESLKLEQELEAKRLQRLREEEEEEAEAEQRRKEAQARMMQQEEEANAIREVQRQREEAELAASAAAATERARVEQAEQELRRQKELENEKRKQVEKAEEERAEREKENRRILDEEDAQKRVQDVQTADQQQDLEKDEMEPFGSASLESIEEVQAATPSTEIVSEAKVIQLEEEEKPTSISKPEATAQEPEKAADESESLAGRRDQDPQEEKEENVSVVIAEEAKPKELTEEEQRQAAGEEKKKQDDATMDVYRQRVLARKAAEKQKQLEMEAEAERKRKEEEKAERQRQQQQQQEDNSNESEQELELSGGSFAESSKHSQGKTRTNKLVGSAAMTLDYELRATRRPLPRQLEVSDWSSESAKASTSTASSSRNDGSTASSLLTHQSRLSSGTSFPPASAYSSRMSPNRYDTPLPVDNQEEWPRHDPPHRKSYESDHSTSGTRHSDPTAAGINWKQQGDSWKRDSWDSSSTTRSPEYKLSSRSWRKQEQRDDAFDNQREDRNRSQYSGRRDSFVDVSPLRYQRDEKADDGNYSFSIDKKYSFASAPERLSASSRDENKTRSPRELNQDRPFFSPFRTTESMKSASPESSKASESDGDSLRLSSKGRTSDFDSESGGEYKQRGPLPSSLSVNEQSLSTRRALFPLTTTSSKSSLHSEGHGESVRSESAPPSPSSSLSSDFSRESSFPQSHQKTHRSQTATITPAAPSDPILSMTERREELYNFRKKMRETFARVDEMVDTHRDFFKTDPGSGVPIFDAELGEEAEKLADAVFADLAGLRERFRQLATDFQDSKAESKAASLPKAGAKAATSTLRKQTRAQRSSDVDSSDEESEVKSRTSTAPSSSTHSKPTTFASTIGESTVGSAYASSIRLSSPTFTSSHRHHTRFNGERGRTEEQEEEKEADLTRSTVYSEDEDDAGSVSAIMNDNFSELSARISSRVSFPYAASTLPSRDCERNTSDANNNNNRSSSGDDKRDEDGNVFKDFDKRMEEIRVSLHLIARGKSKEPTGSTAPSQSTISAVRGHRERSANAPSHSARGDFQMAALSSPPSPPSPRFPSRVGKSSEKILPADHHHPTQSDAFDDDLRSCRDTQLHELLKKLSETGKGL